MLLPSIKNLIDSKHEEYKLHFICILSLDSKYLSFKIDFFKLSKYSHMIVGTESCKIVFKNFGKLIRSNILAPYGVGVDISREERLVGFKSRSG